jgi:peptidoglycan/LPS O-acetylase OafA/YrhL
MLAATAMGMRTGLEETAEPATYFLRLAAGPVSAVGTLVLVYAAATSSPRVEFLRGSTIVFFGTISYALYLWHVLIDHILGDRWGSTGLHGLASGTTAAVLAIGVAVASKRWVEDPALRLKRRFEPAGARASAVGA